MKQINVSGTSLLVATAFLLLGLQPIQAQRVGGGEHTLSLLTGPARYTGRMLGVAGSASQMRKGWSWSARYTYLPASRHYLRMGLGFLYQGNRYAGSSPQNTDRVSIHYWAPQVSLHGAERLWNWHLAIGTGYRIHRDCGTVYGKPRRVSMDRWAANVGAGVEFRPAARWGINLAVDYQLAGTDRYTVRYHGNTWNVQPDYPLDRSFDLSQLSLQAGISYYF